MDQVTTKLLDSPLKTCTVSLTVVSIGYLAIKGIKNILSKPHNSHSYPPGPPRRPLIGAVGSFPKDHVFEHFCKWATLYGDIVYAPLLGVDLIVLNSYEISLELLSKRPNSTAGRRIPYLIQNLMKTAWATSFIQPGHRHSQQRKMIRRGIGPQRVGSYDSSIETEVAKLMVELEMLEGSPVSTVNRALGHFVIKVTYGEKILAEMGDNLTRWNVELNELAAKGFLGFWLVDYLHFLRFIPSWVPGAHFKQLAQEGSALSDKVLNIAYARGLELHKSGTLGHCILSDLLEDSGGNEDIRDATATLFGAAAETTTSAITMFLHALFLYPDVAKRMFEEIQSVTHGERLLKIADRPSLPYTEATFKEAMRRSPILPLGLPHVNDRDEVLRGYFIPKGTMIHQNIGLMLNNPQVWGDPDVFRPERFMEPEASRRPNPLTVIFGYGMRVCPGMYLADRMVFHIVATINSLFHIVPLQGKTIPDPDTVVNTDTFIRLPVGFECRFVPRDEKAYQLIKMVSLLE